MLGRLLNQQPAAVGVYAAAVYAACAMLYRAFIAHTGVLDMDVLVAGLGAVWALWTYVKVTPLARPRDADGRELVPYRTHNPHPGDDLSGGR